MISCKVATWRANAPRPAARRGHGGLRLLADKGLVDRDIAGLGQRLDMGAEIAVGGAGQLFQPGEFEPRAGGSAFNAAMIRKRSGWWMMSSSSAIGQLRRIQRPPRMSPPPLTNAIHGWNDSPTKK